MESVLSRYRNLIILVGVLFAQVLGLAVQVKRTTDTRETRLIRVWTVSAVTPFEKSIVWFRHSTYNVWHNYMYLRGVRQENRDLKAEIERLRIEHVRLQEDAEQARRLQSLLAFKEEYISQTLAAQVIGSTGSESSRAIFIDKGSKNGLETDMPVITADGIVGKVFKTFNSTALVLLLNDQTSGVGAILEKSRVQGVAKGTATGEIVLDRVMNDEAVQIGERVLTSGGDRIFPKGLPLGTVTQVTPGSDVFLNIRIKPNANLARLEEVLVITKKEEKQAVAEGAPSTRAADVLAQRLPGVPDKPAVDANKAAEASKPGSDTAANTPKPNNQGVANQSKPVPKTNPAVPPRPEGVSAQQQNTPVIKTTSSQPGAGATLVERSPKPATSQPAAQTGAPPQ